MSSWKIFQKGEIVNYELFAWFYLIIYMQMQFGITGSMETNIFT